MKLEWLEAKPDFKLVWPDLIHQNKPQLNDRNGPSGLITAKSFSVKRLMMNKFAVFHVSDTPWAYAKDETTLTLRIRTAFADLTRVTVHYKDRYDWSGSGCAEQLKKIADVGLFTYWSCDISLSRSRFRYFFELEDTTGEIACYDEGGWHSLEEGFMEERAFQYAYIGKADLYLGREVLQEAIVYQIFP